jgi:hypothetical protein
MFRGVWTVDYYSVSKPLGTDAVSGECYAWMSALDSLGQAGKWVYVWGKWTQELLAWSLLSLSTKSMKLGCLAPKNDAPVRCIDFYMLMVCCKINALLRPTGDDAEIKNQCTFPVCCIDVISQTTAGAAVFEPNSRWIRCPFFLKRTVVGKEKPMSHVVEMVSETSIISGKDMQSLLSLLVHSFIQTTVDSIVFIFSGPREAVTEFMWGKLVAKDSTSWFRFIKKYHIYI